MYLWLEKTKDGKIRGHTEGCGCCGSVKLLNRNDLEEHIRELEEKLANALEMRNSFG